MINLRLPIRSGHCLNRTHFDPTDGCTLAEELLPPSQRPSIHEMMEMGKRPKKYERKFEPRTGLDYYPFKR